MKQIRESMLLVSPRRNNRFAHQAPHKDSLEVTTALPSARCRKLARAGNKPYPHEEPFPPPNGAKRPKVLHKASRNTRSNKNNRHAKHPMRARHTSHINASDHKQSRTAGREEDPEHKKKKKGQSSCVLLQLSLFFSLAEGMIAQLGDLHFLRRGDVRPRDVEPVVDPPQVLVGALVCADHRRLRQPHHEAMHVVFPAAEGEFPTPRQVRGTFTQRAIQVGRQGINTITTTHVCTHTRLPPPRRARPSARASQAGGTGAFM